MSPTNSKCDTNHHITTHDTMHTNAGHVNKRQYIPDAPFGIRSISIYLHAEYFGTTNTFKTLSFMKSTSKSGVVCFKRWSRKGYGAFASLGKVTKIGVLSTTMSILTLNAQNVSAQTDSLHVNQQIESVTVTAEKLNPTRGVVSPKEVYSRDTVSASPLQTIESVLRLNPAIDLRERGGKGVQADISLRGGTYDQTMVLLNGIDFSDARTGHQSHSLPVDLDIVGAIDLITGLPGIGAYSGAINIVTTPLKPNYLRAETAAGAYGYLYANASGAVSRNGLTVLAAASNRRSDGYMANTDFNNSNMFARITHYSSRTGLFDIQGGYQRRGFGSNGFYSLSFPDQYEETETGLASVRWNKSFGRLALNANVSYRKNNDKYELYREGKGAPEGWKPNYHTTDNVGAEINANYRWIAGITTIGADYKYHHIYSNVLGDDMDEAIKVPGQDAYYTKSKDRSIINGYLSHTAVLGGTTLSGSVNIAHSPYGTFPAWSLAVKQSLAGKWTVEANVTRSMRLPTFTDLYYTNATHIGNPDLKPEKALTAMIGARYGSEKLHAGVTGFYRYGTDIIDYALVQTPEGEKWKSTQMTRLNTFGAEAYVSYLGGGILRHVTLSYGWLSSDKSQIDYVSKYALDYMKNKVAIQFGINLWKELFLEMSAGWFDRNATPTAPYDPYWLLDARLSWERGILTVYVEGTNLLNTAYYDFVGLRQAPRWMSAGIVISI